MFDRVKASFRRRAVSAALGLAVRRTRGELIDMRECWRDIRRYMLCWTGCGADRDAVELVLDRLRRRFPTADAVVVATRVIDPPRLEGVAVELLTERDFNLFGLPGREARRRVRELHADVAVDLSPRFDPLSAYLCLISGAPVKVGFASAGGDSVFNLQIVPEPERTGLERYRVLARYIG